MFRSESALRRGAAFALVVGAWLSSLAAPACQLGDGSCLRMSDCERGYVCDEGTCVSNAPAIASTAPPAADAAHTSERDASEAAALPTSSDAGVDGNPTDASDATDAAVTDGSVTDGETDA